MSVTPDRLATYPVMEHFYTIQGEGFYTGRPAYFIRLAGCDVGCTWCDVKESWDAGKHPVLPVQDLLEAAGQFPAKFVVITGGEPAMYDLGPLFRSFQDKGFEVAIETSGAYALTAFPDWICLSPKKFKSALPQMLRMANELKVVVYHASDFAWAEEQALGVDTNCKLFLQPEFSRFDRIVPALVDYVKEHPAWSISLQTHKIIHVP